MIARRQENSIMVYRYQSLKGIKNFLDLIYNEHKNKNWDTVACICGGVGKSKSNLALHMLEYWQNLLYGECKPQDIKHMNMGTQEFIKDLADCKQVEITVYDEAGELSSRSAMSKMNKTLMVTYQIIRADRIFTLLVLPDIWYIDSYFRDTRIKHLFHVHQRGKVSYWNTSKLKKILALNETRRIKNYYVVEPTFTDSFPHYKGVMAEAYEDMKKKKTSQARQDLTKDLDNRTNEIKEVRNKIILNMAKREYTQIEISKCVGLSQQHVGRVIKAHS